MNDLFYIFYEPKVMFTDTADMSGPAERAHRRLCDYIWFNDGPPLNQNDTLRQLSHTEAADWGRVKRELMQKGWLERDPYFLHGGAIELLNESKKSYVADFNRQAAMNKKQRLLLSPPDPVTGVVTYSVTVSVTPTVTDTQSESESKSSKTKEREGAEAPKPKIQIPSPKPEEPFPSADVPTLKEVLELAQMSGVPAETAERFWQYNEGEKLWRNRHGALVNVRVKLLGWWNRERAAAATGGSGERGAGRGERAAPSAGSLVYALTKAREAKESLAKSLFDRYASEGPLSTDWSEKGKQSEWRVLKREIQELTVKIAKAV